MSFSLISDQKKKKNCTPKSFKLPKLSPKKEIFQLLILFFKSENLARNNILLSDQTKPNHFIRGSNFRLLYSNNCHSAGETNSLFLTVFLSQARWIHKGGQRLTRAFEKALALIHKILKKYFR